MKWGDTSCPNLLPYAWKCLQYEIFANCQLNKIFAFLFSRMLAPFPSELPGRLPRVLLLSCWCHYRRLAWRSVQLFLTCLSESTVCTRDVHRWEMFASVTSFAKFAKILYHEHFRAYGRPSCGMSYKMDPAYIAGTNGASCSVSTMKCYNCI